MENIFTTHVFQEILWKLDDTKNFRFVVCSVFSKQTFSMGCKAASYMS